MDKLAALFDRFAPKISVFYTGNLCHLVDFDTAESSGYLHILKSGALTVKSTTGPEMRFEKPTLLFLPNSKFHRFEPDATCGADLMCATVDLGGKQGNPLALGLPEQMVIPLATIPALEPTLELLTAEAFGEYSARQAAMNRLVEYFLILLLRHVIDNGVIEGGILAALGDPRLAPAIAAMHDQPQRTWTLEDLAMAAGMSRARFADHFRKVVERTPMEYLTQWRMTVAQQLIRQGKPVKTIASDVGYNSPAALTRAFTKTIGQSPRAWLCEQR